MTTPRLFTLEEASALLPVLAPLLEELRQKMAVLDRKQGELQAAGEQRRGGNGYHLAAEQQATRLQREVERLTNELKDDLETVLGYGCEVKDIRTGLIDFRSLREGRVVYLCWRLGEPAIEHWHELDAGFAGRQRL